MDTSTADSLIRILLDKSRYIGERDDAAMDLGSFDEPEALDVLIQVATDVREDDMILSSCGSSIKNIWIRQGSYSLKKITVEMLNALTPEAKHECNIKIPLAD